MVTAQVGLYSEWEITLMDVKPLPSDLRNPKRQYDLFLSPLAVLSRLVAMAEATILTRQSVADGRMSHVNGLELNSTSSNSFQELDATSAIFKTKLSAVPCRLARILHTGNLA